MMDVGCWRYGCQETILDTDPTQTCWTFTPEDRLQAFDLRGVGGGGKGPNALKYQNPLFIVYLQFANLVFESIIEF